jgi:predicted Zn-dependent peptidase
MWALHLLTAPDQAATVARLGQEYLRRFPAETHWEWNLKAVGGERAAGWLWLLQQPTNLADALAEAEQFNLGLDYPWQAWIQCAHFTSEQLQRVATQWMSADDCRTLIVGP